METKDEKKTLVLIVDSKWFRNLVNKKANTSRSDKKLILKTLDKQAGEIEIL